MSVCVVSCVLTIAASTSAPIIFACRSESPLANHFISSVAVASFHIGWDGRNDRFQAEEDVGGEAEVEEDEEVEEILAQHAVKHKVRDLSLLFPLPFLS